MAQTLEKLFLQKVSQLPKEELEVTSITAKEPVKGRKMNAGNLPKMLLHIFWGGFIEVRQIFSLPADIFDNSLYLLPCRCYQAEIPCVRSCSPADSDSHSSWCASVHPAHPALSTNWCHSKYFMSSPATFTVYMLTLNLIMNSVKTCRGCLSF